MTLAERVQYGTGDFEPSDQDYEDVETLKRECDAHVKRLIDQLEEQTNALRSILENERIPDAAANVLHERINMLGEWVPARSSDLWYYLQELAQ